MDKSRQEKAELRRKKENEAINCLLVWFAGAIVYEAVVLFLKRFYIGFGFDMAEINLARGISNVFMVLQFVAPVLAVAALVWYIRCRKADKPTRLPAVGIWVCAALALTAIVAYNFREVGVAALGMVAPVAAVLALIYFLYQKEFFCNAVLAGAGIVALWVYRKAYMNHPRTIYVGFALVWIILVVAVVLAWKLSRNKGRWGDVQIFSAKASYVPTYVTAGLAAVLLLAVLVMPVYGATIAYYAIFALFTWLFCMAVYYTVRMM